MVRWHFNDVDPVELRVRVKLDNLNGYVDGDKLVLVVKAPFYHLEVDVFIRIPAILEFARKYVERMRKGKELARKQYRHDVNLEDINTVLGV